MRRGYHAMYIPELIVYHERRKTYVAFCKQIYTYGRGRCQIIKYVSNAIQTFIPPFDKITTDAFRVIVEEGMNIPINISNFRLVFSPLFSLKHKIALLKSLLCRYKHVQLINVETSKIYFYKEKLNSNKNRYIDLSREFKRKDNNNRIFIITNHYWEFFDRELKRETDLLYQWHAFIDRVLLRRDAVQFTTFQ